MIQLPVCGDNSCRTAAILAVFVNLERPDSEAPVIGRLEAAAKVAMTARSGGFVRVDMGEGRPGWVRSDAISASSGKPGTAQVAWSTPNAAPEVALDGPQTYATTADSITLRGRATDLLLWVWGRTAGPVEIFGDAELAEAFRTYGRR